MIRASDLSGRAVVDMDAAEKLGNVGKVIIDPDGRRVAGFVVTKRTSVFDKRTHVTVSAEAIHAIGPDALTVHRAGAADVSALDALPRVSDVVGRKVVSETGRLLGSVSDVLIDEKDCRIIGYALRDTHAIAGLDGILGRESRDDRAVEYLRADADLRRGPDLIVAPENAVAHDAIADEPGIPRERVATPPVPARPPRQDEVPAIRWADDEVRRDPLADAPRHPDAEEFLDPGPDR